MTHSVLEHFISFIIITKYGPAQVDCVHMYVMGAETQKTIYFYFLRAINVYMWLFCKNAISLHLSTNASTYLYRKQIIPQMWTYPVFVLRCEDLSPISFIGQKCKAAGNLLINWRMNHFLSSDFKGISKVEKGTNSTIPFKLQSNNILSIPKIG